MKLLGRSKGVMQRPVKAPIGGSNPSGPAISFMKKWFLWRPEPPISLVREMNLEIVKTAIEQSERIVAVLNAQKAQHGGFMALETLKGVSEIGGFKVVVMDELREKHPEKFNESGAMDYKWFEKDVRPHNFIYVRHDVNSIAFTIQNGPVKEHGLNGCQVDTIIEAAKIMVEGLNAKFPCRENSMIITKLDEALMWSKKRKADREKRGVEGHSKA